MNAKKFYEEHTNNTWWNASTDMIEIKADDLWKLMDEYAMHLAKNISFNLSVSGQVCRTFFPDEKTTSATKCQFCGKEKWEH